MPSMSRLLTAVALALAPVAVARAADPLQIVQFDFEGAGGTLFITPDKRALLVDTGWPPGVGGPAVPSGAPPATGFPSNAQRIASELKKRGIARIDYLLTTHYHDDHVGGLAELVRLVPVETFVDHGENREPLPANVTDAQRARAPATLYAQYLAAIAGKKRKIAKAGDRLRLGGMTLDITNADGEVLRRPLHGGGGGGVGCPRANMDRMGREEDHRSIGVVAPYGRGEENVRSIGFVARYGRARVILLGDTVRKVETRLVCPLNLIGPVDLMLATQHGSSGSNDPVVYATLRPRVVVIGNGRTKGGDPSTYDAITAAPGLQGLWQVHEAVKDGAKNGPAEHIANPASAPDANHPLLIAVQKNGTLTVTNPRNGVSQVYPKSR